MFKSRKQIDRSEKKYSPGSGVNLIDYNQIVISTITATFKPAEPLPIELARATILSCIRKNVVMHKNNYPNVIICADNAIGGYWRKLRIAPYYKYTRKESRNNSEFDYSKIFDIMRTVLDELEQYAMYPVMNIPHIEADDHIGVLTEYFVNKGHPVLITSSDSDFTQLQTSKMVHQWSPMGKKWVSPKHGSARNDLLYKCFRGDKKDSIANYKSESDHFMCEGKPPRMKSIYQKDLDLLLTSTEDELKYYLNDEQIRRYKENKSLCDLTMIPDDIKQNIISYYEEYKIHPVLDFAGYLSANECKLELARLSDY